MNFNIIILYFLCLIVLSPLLGWSIAQIFLKDKHFLSPPLGWLEKAFYRLAGINPKEEMNWKTYLKALIAFNFFGFLFVFLLQIFQFYLPLNPENLPNVSWHLALNTAISFMTNTNWQAYSGESTLSFLTQLLGLCVQNFLSAATALAVMVALARGISRKSTLTIGNFWSDLVKSSVYVLFPISAILALILIQQGVIQNFAHYVSAKTLEGVSQIIPMGPAASQIAIKQLGTNGGGFFGVNSAHPFENPTAFSNFLEMLSILLLPSSLVFTFGLLIKNMKHAFSLWATMGLFLIVGLGIALWAQHQGNPSIGGMSFLEGIESRLGLTNSTIWGVATTAASNGSVNAMHDSFSPLAGLIFIFNMALGEIIFGGVGCGLYGMVLFSILTVFLAGLMVGRTPEYLGKKIMAPEVIWACIGVLAPSLFILGFSAFSLVYPPALSSLTNQGPHGLSEILYAFTSAIGNNGSAFGGLSVNTPFYNLSLGFCMLVGRFLPLVATLAIAQRFSEKKTSPVSVGTFPMFGGLFISLLVAVIFIVGALTFFPALVLGPVLEHLLMMNAKVF